MKIAVIGAGPAGMSAAYCLSKHNYQVDIYEASILIGGLASTINLWNQRVDIGPHRFFSSDKRVNLLWLEVIGKDYEIINRLTRIYYNKKLYYYPLKINNVLKNLGPLESLKCIVSYLFKINAKKNKTLSFEDWVKSRFGKRLYEIFFKTYTEKLWGIKCDQLDADFAAQRIKKLSMFELIKNAFLEGKGNKHRTLIDQFAYPLGGTGVVYDKMAEFVKKRGSKIFLNTPVKSINTEMGKVKGIELLNGRIKNYDHVVSTMPYTSMVKRLPDVPEKIKKLTKELNYRNTVIVYLLINSDNVFIDNWLYVHSSDLQMGRITNFRNWSPSLYKNERKTILAIEYWCNENDKIWAMNDKDFIKLASEEIIKTELVKKELIEDGYVFRINKSYPVYRKGYKNLIKPIENYVTSIQGLSAIGRNGSFKYNNQDHSILMGLLAAENITHNVGHKLNEINSDYETYQESYIISHTGLVRQK